MKDAGAFDRGEMGTDRRCGDRHDKPLEAL